MSSVLKVYALFLGSALLMFGGGLQGLLLSVRGAEEGFSLVSLGLIGTGWSVGFVAGSIGVPIIVQKVGHIRAFSVMAAIGTVTILCNLLLINDVSWIILRAASGFCFAGAAMIVESWLNEVSENRSRGTTFSIYVTINMVASTMGQMAMSVTGVTGYVPFVVGAISFICAVLPSALTSTPQPRPLQSARLDLGLLYRTSPVAAIASFSVGMANGTFGTLAPVYGYRQGLDASGIAFLFSVTAILGALAQIPAGRLSDRIDRRQVMVILSGVAALTGLLIVLVNPGPGVAMYVLFGVYGFTAFPIYAIAVAHANDFAREGDFAKVAGGMLVTLGVGLAIGPAVASLVMNAWQPVGLFVVTATFHGALAISAFLRMRMRQPREASTREPFRPMAGDKAVTPESVVLDPRADEEPRPLTVRPEEDKMFKSDLDETKAFVPLSIAVLAVSDTRTLETDTGGALLKSLLEGDGHKCAERAVVRDDIPAIRARVMGWANDPEVDAVITTGGTGFTGRDVTPEALEPLFDKRIEGFSVLFHMYSTQNVGTSTIQSRAMGGLIGTTFVFCLPGSRGACRDGWEGILRAQLDNRHKPCNFVELMPRLAER